MDDVMYWLGWGTVSLTWAILFVIHMGGTVRKMSDGE
jgi:hypothetical protein